MRKLATVLAASLVFVLVPAALATLPKTKNTTIVPGKAAGGITLGQSAPKARKAWGKGSCTVVGKGKSRIDSCVYTSGRKPTQVGKNGSASFVAARRKVTQINITTGVSGKRRLFRGPLMKWKTAEGIGLGASRKALRKAYGKKLKKAGPNAYQLFGKRRAITTLTVANGRLVQILIDR